MNVRLVDERSSPNLRRVIGDLIRHASAADFAVGHVRLSAIDLSVDELSHVACCRLLLDRLDAEMLSDAADAASSASTMRNNLEQLLSFARSGRLELRSAVTPQWSPDFSVYRGMPTSEHAPDGVACLIGAHYFSRPVVLDGASLTCVLTDGATVGRAGERFDELWSRAHDVLPVVVNRLESCIGP